uniref:Uncharacterized protein n=1 Tax=Varanus komodoensis TaxID=61221 RepID=A0A8D2IXV2_VARKO
WALPSSEVGGWNITGPWKETDFNQTLQILMEKYNTFPFFKAYVGPIFSDPKQTQILFDSKVYSFIYFLQVLRSYYLYLLKLGKLMGGHPDVTSTYISLAFSFISNLQKAVTPLKTRQEKKMLFYRTTIRELQEKAPAIDWLSCLRAAFYPVQLNISQPIVAHDMDYLKGMSQLIEQWQQKRDVLQIYMILCLVRNLSPALSRQFQEARQVLADILERGTRDSEMVRTERWRKCLSETGTFFGPVLGRMVVDAFRAFLLILAGLDSGGSGTQLPPELAGMLLQRKEIGWFLEFLLLSLSLKKKNCFRWEVAPWSVHSYYSLRRHAVVFPAGMFRNPFFNIAFPSAVNFGAMGFFMAHELLHSFYEYVLPKNCSVCDVRTLPQGISCLVKQFESYSLKGYSINSTFTLLENAADTGGLAIAYQAYKNWHAKHRGVKELPWPGLSHRQLFFISFAHVIHTLLFFLISSDLSWDPHSPPPLRVLGSLRNSQDFARNFHCSSKSSMNPVLKCRIW